MTSEQKLKIKKILSVTGNVLLWAFVVFSALITILVFAAQNTDDGVPELFGKSFITIETPSMEPVYKVGDLVILQKIDVDEAKKLEPGDIITFKTPVDINGDGKIGDLNTHRVESHDPSTGVIQTKSENGVLDSYTLTYFDVIGICQPEDRVGGVGNVLKFLRSSLGFFLCIVLPLILFFIYELYCFIALLVSERAKKAPVAKETEEEIKRRAIEEYLKQQEMAAGGENTAPDGEKQSEDTPPDGE